MPVTGSPASPPRWQAAATKFMPLVLLGTGLVVFIVAFTLDSDDQGDVIISSNPGIELLIPAPGSEVLRQEQVGVDLAAGLSAELEINGVPIPPDEVNVLRSDIEPAESNATTGTFGSTLNRFVYQPLEGRAVPELKADENCVVATFWPLADPTDISEVRWCFTAA